MDARPAPCLDLELVCGGTWHSGCRQFQGGDEGDPPIEGCGADASSYSCYWGTRVGVDFRGENSVYRMFAWGQL
jgi:hypothetical protein